MTQTFQTRAQDGSFTPILGRILQGHRGSMRTATPVASAASTVQVQTLTLSGTVDGTDYAVRFTDGDGIDFVVAFEGGANDTASASNLSDAIDASSASGFYTSDSSGGVVTVTGRGARTDLTIEAADTATAAVLTVAETTPPSLSPPAASFGRFVALTQPGSSDYLRNMKWGEPGTVTQATAVLTLTYASATTYSTVLLISDLDGSLRYSGSVSWSDDTNLADTVAAAVVALEAALPSDIVVTTEIDGSDGIVTLTAPLGWSIAVGNAGADGSGTLSGATTAEGDAPTLALVFDNETITPTTIGGDVTAYPAGLNPAVLVGGGNTVVAVPDPGASLPSDGRVFVGSDGVPYAAQNAAGSRIPLPLDRWQWRTRYTGLDLATIQTQD